MNLVRKSLCSIRLMITVIVCLVCIRCFIELVALPRRKSYNMYVSSLVVKNSTSGTEKIALKQPDSHSNWNKWRNVSVVLDQGRAFCAVRAKTNFNYSFPKMKTNWKTWSFKTKVKGPTFYVKNIVKHQKTEPLISLLCGQNGRNVLHVQSNDDKVQRIPSGHLCLDTFIETCCTDSMAVPNVVHYVWYGRNEFSFYAFVSFVSVIRFLRPCVILVHGNRLPDNYYWKCIVNIFPNIIHVSKRVPIAIYGKTVKYKPHISDLFRLEALIQYGGIYLDMDMVMVKPIDFLRKYPFTISKMRDRFLASSFIMAERNATFLQKWMDGYRYHYNSSNYLYNAMKYPNEIAKNYSHLLHVEHSTLCRPWKQHGDKIYFSNFDWSFIYGMHLYSRLNKNQTADEISIRDDNSTFGAICRHILFGNKELCIP